MQFQLFISRLGCVTEPVNYIMEVNKHGITGGMKNWNDL